MAKEKRKGVESLVDLDDSWKLIPLMDKEKNIILVGARKKPIVISIDNMTTRELGEDYE